MLIAGVARVDAAPDRDRSSDSKRSSKPSKQSSSSKTEAKKSKKKSRSDDDTRVSSKRRDKKKGRKSKEARVSWTPSRSTINNFDHMPHGFTWPPTPAMRAAEKECEAKLQRAGVEFKSGTEEGRIVNPIVVPSMTFGGVKYTNTWGSEGPHTMDCQLALALETIGPELYALGVREVKFGSIYRWSNVRAHGVTKPILSRHGLGLAMDIASFVDESGRTAVVAKDYTSDDPLLLGIEQTINANGNFRTLLTPKNDPISHDDHFHIEARAEFSADHP
ncbi:MAG TPA: extensin family protein [Kofleriaceae bacterium]|nr:extensin family protein [Kofleriaceae bacterium]